MAQGIGVAELAYLGDAVFELMVRDMLVNAGVPFKELNNIAKMYVSATAQGEMYHSIFDSLPDEEQAIMKRGRNLHGVSRSKSAKVSEYRHATGLEVLFGHLHYTCNQDRLHEIFKMCTAERAYK